MNEPRITITQIVAPTKSDTIFFDILLELGFGAAVIIRGWKITIDGTMHPPASSSKGKFYSSVLCSPGFAKAVFDALWRADPSLDLDENGWVSSKWGKAGLAYSIPDPARARELYEKYRGGSSENTRILTRRSPGMASESFRDS